ncbi:MAG: xanthine dehydrogenase family protein molybdopterin-binding subunit [Rhodospirillales bacterium]|nr:xanthine dehydrogenase family protein molybdopterin-binding subunit [Rhodospirillales bacterium]
MTEVLDTVGKRVTRLEGKDKASGRAQYTDDMTLPGMLYGAIAVSPHAHANILSYNISAALEVPGVKAVITGDDYNWFRSGGHVKDETLLAKGKVRYIGEPVAAVAARTQKAAEEAALLIQVEYEELVAVLSIDDAMNPDLPIIHEEFSTYQMKVTDLDVSGNECWVTSAEEGDIDSAWAECDAVVEETFETQAQHHLYLEPASALADVDANGKVTVWGPNQGVHFIQTRTADYLGLPLTKVRAISPTVGGGFGGRAGPHMQPIAAALALKSGKPVKITLSRAMDFETCRSRHPSRVRMKIGAKKDGTFVAQEAELLFDGGSFMDETPAVASFGLMMARGPYRIPNFRGSARAFYANKLRAGSFRGFGNPQTTIARECLIDRLAQTLELSPMEVRQKNAMVAGDKWLGGQEVPACGFAQCLEEVEKAAELDKAQLPPPALGKKRGFGFSGFAHISSFLASGASVQLREDGTVTMNTGGIEIGQGASTILAQICAEALKLPIESINVTEPDTDTTPYNYKSVGSRTTYTTGRAVKAAAEDVADQIIEHAAAMLDCDPAQLTLISGGQVGVKSDVSDSPLVNRTITFKEASLRAHYGVGGPIIGTHTFVFDGPPFDREGSKMKAVVFGNMGAYIYGVQGAAVDVDEITGQVEVVKAWAAADVGKAINPTNIEGQIQGGFAQGMGYALYEEMVWDNGRLVNPTLMEYKVPGVKEVPKVHTIIVEDPEPAGPYGAKGVGEPAMVGVAPAIANAIDDAIGGRPNSLPMTPEKVLDVLDPSS